jgi:hypothetical protein
MPVISATLESRQARSARILANIAERRIGNPPVYELGYNPNRDTSVSYNR